MPKIRYQEKKPVYYAYQRIISKAATCGYCGLPQNKWIPEPRPNIEKSGKIRCGSCTCKKFGLEIQEDVIQTPEQQKVFMGSPNQYGGLF